MKRRDDDYLGRKGLVLETQLAGKRKGGISKRDAFGCNEGGMREIGGRGEEVFEEWTIRSGDLLC